MRAALHIGLAVAVAACGNSDKPKLQREQPEPPRRVIEPSPRGVRALPPHAIRVDGVGPYKLGASTAQVLDQLPSGPRIRQFTIPGIVHRDMLRGEDDAILIGTEPQGKALFVAVVRGEIARTEAGIQVGSTREELEKELGPPIDDPDRARDPHVVIPTKLDNAHVLIENERIRAIVLVPAVERAKDTSTEGCLRPPSDRKQGTLGACLTPAGELVRVGNEEVTVLAREGDKPLATARIPGLVFAAPLRHEAKDDLVAITREDLGETRTWSLTVYRMVEGKLLRAIEPTVLYQLTAAHARWIGADLRDLDIFIELAAKPDAIEVGGLLATRNGNAIQDIVAITPVNVARRKTKTPANELVDAGVSDAGPAQDAANAPRTPR